jgi:hypothetical protein
MEIAESRHAVGGIAGGADLAVDRSGAVHERHRLIDAALIPAQLRESLANPGPFGRVGRRQNLGRGERQVLVGTHGMLLSAMGLGQEAGGPNPRRGDAVGLSVEVEQALRDQAGEVGKLARAPQVVRELRLGLPQKEGEKSPAGEPPVAGEALDAMGTRKGQKLGRPALEARALSLGDRGTASVASGSLFGSTWL